MYQIKVRDSELSSADLEVPGVSMKVLHRDEATGAMAALTRRGSGAVIPAHWHTNTDEMSFVLHGDLVEDGEGFGPGSKSLEFGWMPPNPATNGKRSGRFTATAHGTGRGFPEIAA